MRRANEKRHRADTSTHRAPIDRVQAQARVRVAVRHRAAHGDVVIHEDVLPALGVGEDRLATRRVDITVRSQHERAPGASQVLAGFVEEGAVRGGRASDEHLVFVPGWGERGRAEAATET